ncbi:MAG TPA: cupin-like domain-containing protein, partial [Aestuariivirgaceae bacterium]|nr:cupin-like domain-containing protein [Aestuariivirgaceae bacterium]
MPLIELDRSTARASFHRAPFAMRHTLAGHDLFTLPRLVELAKSMPRDRIEYNSGKLEPGVRPEEVPGIAMPAEDVIRRIENADAWLVIKGVERDPAYRALLHEFLTEVSSAAGPATERFEDLQGFIFVSSAGSVTPFHFDAEENILVQIRGDKYVHIFDNADRSLVPEESLELSPAKHRNQPYRVEFERRAEVFSLSPGDAVHIPYLWPHWVHTGSSWCVSMAMTWKTPVVR